MARLVTKQQLVALSLLTFLGACEKRDNSDSGGSSGTSGETATSTDDTETDESSETGDVPDPEEIQMGCEAACATEIECIPDAIPTYYASMEECVEGCIEARNRDYRNGCGPVKLMLMICHSQLTCEEYLELVETGYSSCGDFPGAQWCGD